MDTIWLARRVYENSTVQRRGFHDINDAKVWLANLQNAQVDDFEWEELDYRGEQVDEELELGERLIVEELTVE